MLNKILLGYLLMAIFGLTPVLAADIKGTYSIKAAMELEKIKVQLPGDISFYWGKQPHPSVLKDFGTLKVSKRTNAFAKEDSDACSWAMASALKVFQRNARARGGNAVINIVSNIKNVEESSETNFSCLIGSIMVNVALKGTVVTVK